MTQELLRLLGGQLERGELILFTGAGFSMASHAADGEAVPGVAELKTILWPIAFPGENFDPGSGLGDIFDCALRQSTARVVSVLNRCLKVDSGSLPETYRTWFSMPWRTMYTLNIDDLDLAVQRKFELPVRIKSISALSDPLPSREECLLSVHLNGTLSDLPNVTFSAPQYGERIPGREPWYASLAAELIASPVVFVGTSLDESPLWQHMALRGDRASLDRELRPRSYLVSPSLPVARRGLLRNLNIDHIAMGQQDFAENVLGALAGAAAKGHTRLAERRSYLTRPSPLSRVADLRLMPSKQSLSEYLMGREPSWPDLTTGFAVVREFEAELLQAPSLVEPAITLITGTAGSGKTTTLMRLALELQAQGRDVWWLDLEHEQSIASLKRQVTETAPEVLAIDDIDSLGRHATPFLADIHTDLPDTRILAASRSTRAERLGIIEDVSRLDSLCVVVPPLGDNDIDLLLDALGRASRLGRLRGLTRADQRTALREHASRQLLVAMIEATSGRRFDDKVDDECRELPAGQSLIYSICSLATRFRSWLGRDEILLAASGNATRRLGEFNALVRQHLVVERVPGQFAVRHRVIAERAVGFYRRERRLAPAVEGLLFAMATKVRPYTPRRSREMRWVQLPWSEGICCICPVQRLI